VASTHPDHLLVHSDRDCGGVRRVSDESGASGDDDECDAVRILDRSVET
jgi:hypothetical protein